MIGYGGPFGYYTEGKTRFSPTNSGDRGMILCTHRYYDPINARWLTRDPAGYDGGINLYGYVDGNPIMKYDPSGLKNWLIFIHGSFNLWGSIRVPNTSVYPLMLKTFKVSPNEFSEYTWSGGFDYFTLTQATIGLTKQVKEIIRRDSKAKINLVAYSNGGGVAMMSYWRNGFPQSSIDNIVLVGSPQVYAMNVGAVVQGAIYNVYTLSDTVQFGFAPMSGINMAANAPYTSDLYTRNLDLTDQSSKEYKNGKRKAKGIRSHLDWIISPYVWGHFVDPFVTKGITP